MLRPLIKTKDANVEEGTLVPKIPKMPSREVSQLMEMAPRLGYALTPVPKSRRELAQAIARRMVNRVGDFVYQSAERSPSPTSPCRSWSPSCRRI